MVHFYTALQKKINNTTGRNFRFFSSEFPRYFFRFFFFFFWLYTWLSEFVLLFWLEFCGSSSVSRGFTKLRKNAPDYLEQRLVKHSIRQPVLPCPRFTNETYNSNVVTTEVFVFHNFVQQSYIRRWFLVGMDFRAVA